MIAITTDTGASRTTVLVDHLFRHESGRMVASLTRVLGFDRIDLVEDVVQEALASALRRWPYHGIPRNPTAWLIQVARNRAIDAIRRESMMRDKEAEVRAWAERAARRERTPDSPEADDELVDDQLAMIFACCTEQIGPDARLALTLKSVCGFSTAEIARACLADETTVAQRIVRAKRRILDAGIDLAVPEGAALTARLDSVLEVLYLLFNEGYTAHAGAELIRHDLVEEAGRLAVMLLSNPATARPRTHALVALFLLITARAAGRRSAGGLPLLLDGQDRSRWDRGMIAAGLDHLRCAQEAETLSAYHLQAGIAAAHAVAPTFDATDWEGILRLYDLLWRVQPSPIVALNRAVAVAMVEGLDAGLDALDPLAGDANLARYYLLPATRGEILRRAGRRREAVACFEHALELGGGSEPERALIRGRLESCR